MDKKVYLTLANGKVFEGYSFGAEKEVIGELVFTTNMTGYIDTLTDPSYYGQMVAHTFPSIGNYGMIFVDKESSKCWISAYIVREKCDTPSNFRCEGTLEAYLKEQGIPAIYGIDTRELTKIIREAGVMNAAITFKPLTDFKALKAYQIADAVKAVTHDSEVKTYGEGEYNVVLYNFGVKKNTVNDLLARGCKVTEVPADYTADQVLALNPDGIVLSGGPGNPSENTQAIENIKALIGKKPILGIALGHQLFALAIGGKTRKMKYGHRGSNQPVRELKTGKIIISAQNHGYEVVSESIKEYGTVSYVNVNDGSCEGVNYPAYQAMTIQFQPDSYGGPNDANALYDEFVESMKKVK